jgi:hypothetical protein
MNRVDAEDSGISTADLADANLVNAVSSAFGESVFAKTFDKKIATKGIEFVKAELRALGYDKPRVEIIDGDKNILVYAAHFETRNGLVTVAIPTEIKNDQVLFPSTFVADDHLEELTADKLSYFVDKKSEISNLAPDRQHEESKPDIDITPDVEMPQELAHLSRDFENSVLEAASTFGIEAIRNGKNLIARELQAAGFKNAQVRFGSEGGDSVVYLASIGTPKGPAEIEVPVEMQMVAPEKFIPLSPAYFAYDGLIEDFNISKLQRFAINLPAPSTGGKTYSSAHSYMLLPELKDEILTAASEADYITCESALTEIESRFTEEDFKNAVADYHYILMQKAHMENQEQRSCAKMIAAGRGSIYARCGHFGIPMHQVVVDAEGHCRRKTAAESEKLSPTNESGAAMSSAKVFMA